MFKIGEAVENHRVGVAGFVIDVDEKASYLKIVVVWPPSMAGKGCAAYIGEWQRPKRFDRDVAEVT